jgi:hypothetical protein
MFGLFKKNTSEDSIRNCIELAQRAEIFSVMKEGHYDCFLITLTTRSRKSVDHFRNQNSLAAFTECINTRIQNGQYEDPGSAFSDMREVSGWKPDLNVRRLVVDSENQPMLEWQP